MKRQRLKRNCIYNSFASQQHAQRSFQQNAQHSFQQLLERSDQARFNNHQSGATDDVWNICTLDISNPVQPMNADRTKNQIYIDGIKIGNPKVIGSIYTNYHKAIVQLVEKQQGTKEDAHDVFQEGLVVIYQKVQESNFELTSSFFTFFYAICRNIWYNKRRKISNTQVTLDDNMLSMIKEEEQPTLELSERYFLYRKMFLRLGEDCQKVLSMFLQKISMQKIMSEMGYGSISYTKKRKFLCKQKLVGLIQSDPSFPELKLSENV